MDKARIPGLTDDQDENFIIVLQHHVYELRKRFLATTELAAIAKTKWEDAEKDAKWDLAKLQSVLLFLNIYNPEAHEDWFDEVDIPRPDVS